LPKGMKRNIPMKMSVLSNGIRVVTKYWDTPLAR